MRAGERRRSRPLMVAARHHRLPARTQVVVSALVGLATGVPVAIVDTPAFGALVAWDAAAAFYMGWVWTTIWPLDSEQTALRADHEDPTRATADLLLLSAAVASLVAVGFVLASAAQAHGAAQDMLLTLGLASVAVSWAVVHTVFTLRYARIYYTGPDGGVDFNQDEPPAYGDFAYLAFTVGITFQVSDTAISSREMRRTVLRHSLLSFVFATGILATTVNLVASLTSQ
jgi:uncharacterized membrane protein